MVFGWFSSLFSLLCYPRADATYFAAAVVVVVWGKRAEWRILWRFKRNYNRRFLLFLYKMYGATNRDYESAI